MTDQGRQPPRGAGTPPAGAQTGGTTPATGQPGAAGTRAPRPAPKRTRASATYVAVAIGLIVLILVLIFVVQNGHETRLSFITASFELPAGVIVLCAAVAGGLIVYLVSLARVLQLRMAARRQRRQHVTAARP